MNYYFYNTDATSLTRDHRFPILIEQGFAATSGPASYGEKLGTLSPGDTLVMYENRCGAVAVGTVLENWDGKTHQPALYYQPGDDGFEHEYRIKVNWFLDMTDHPISVEEIKRRLTYIPQAAIRKIVKRRAELERMIGERTASPSFMPEEVASPSLYVEGACRQVSVNAYERNPLARADCIKAHGSDAVSADSTSEPCTGPRLMDTSTSITFGRYPKSMASTSSIRSRICVRCAQTATPFCTSAGDAVKSRRCVNSWIEMGTADRRTSRPSVER